MAHYRIYIIDKSDPISRPPKEVECPNDAAAIDMASRLLDGDCAIEVWCDLRRIIHLAPNDRGFGFPCNRLLSPR
jgi:hypothetical protein